MEKSEITIRTFHSDGTTQVLKFVLTDLEIDQKVNDEQEVILVIVGKVNKHYEN